MAQLNLRTTDVGWGYLSDEVTQIKEEWKILQENEKKIVEDRRRVYLLINKLNNDRINRVYDLLKAEKRAICLLHQYIFLEMSIDNWLVPEEEASIIRIHKSWSTDHRMYDSDITVDHHSFEYDTVACGLCKTVVSKAKIMIGTADHTMAHGHLPEVNNVVELYSTEVIDKISSEYFLMPKVFSENIQSL